MKQQTPNLPIRGSQRPGKQVLLFLWALNFPRRVGDSFLRDELKRKKVLCRSALGIRFPGLRLSKDLSDLYNILGVDATLQVYSRLRRLLKKLVLERDLICRYCSEI